jgi:hypothetical protein
VQIFVDVAKLGNRRPKMQGHVDDLEQNHRLAACGSNRISRTQAP